MKKILLENPYSDNVYLLYNCSNEDYIKFIADNFPNHQKLSGSAGGRVENPIDKNGIQHFYIWVEEQNTKSDIRLTVIHETLHLVFFLMQYIGITLNDKTDETYAYLQDYLCKQIFIKLGVL